MTRTEALSALAEAQKMGDSEHAHLTADGILIQFLEALGYQDVAEAWRKVDRWYA